MVLVLLDKEKSGRGEVVFAMQRFPERHNGFLASFCRRDTDARIARTDALLSLIHI